MAGAKIYDAIIIADEILKIAKEAGKRLTPLQLMKLTYIAQGWSLGLGRGHLFRNKIEAWKYGPVIPDLYQATKIYGCKEIPLNLINENVSSVDDATDKFLRNVYGQYSRYTGVQLSSFTHVAGTPWYQVYRNGVPNIEISDDLIKRHYQELNNERRSAAED